MGGDIKDPSAWTDEADGWGGMEAVRRERGEQGFSKADWINFDTYIAWVIHNAVVKMKSDGHTMFMFEGEPDSEWERLTNEEYDVMIKGFGTWAEGKFELNGREAQERAVADLDAALDIFKKRFKSLWD